MISSLRLRRFRGFAFAILLLSGPAAAQEPVFASASQKAQTSAARLLAGGVDKEGVYTAGIEIDLDPATVTYWRQPGEAGAPPVLDFSRSQNVASMEMLFPTPKHFEEAGSMVAGYDVKVIFPLRVTPRDAKAPVLLNLALDYAACGKICLPARAQLSLLLPSAGVSPHAQEIGDALARVPKKLTPAQARGLFALTRRDGQSNAWRLRYLGRGKARDLFAEAPEPLFLDAAPAKGAEGFDLTLTPAPQAPVDATLTIVTDEGAYEARVPLE